MQLYMEKKEHSKPPVSLLGQLLWREFYYTAAAHTPNYHQKEGNPICKRIPWDDNLAYFKVLNCNLSSATQAAWFHLFIDLMNASSLVWCHHELCCSSELG